MGQIVIQPDVDEHERNLESADCANCESSIDNTPSIIQQPTADRLLKGPRVLPRASEKNLSDGVSDGVCGELDSLPSPKKTLSPIEDTSSSSKLRRIDSP